MPEPIDKTTMSRPVEPVQVTVVATGDASRLTSGTVAQTPGEHQPNIIANVIGPARAIGIRFGFAFFTQLVALVGAALPTGLIPASDFGHLVMKCAILSVAGAGFGALKDVATIFGRLEQKYPLLSGSA